MTETPKHNVRSRFPTCSQIHQAVVDGHFRVTRRDPTPVTTGEATVKSITREVCKLLGVEYEEPSEARRSNGPASCLKVIHLRDQNFKADELLKLPKNGNGENVRFFARDNPRTSRTGGWLKR